MPVVGAGFSRTSCFAFGETSVMNPYSYVGPVVDPAGTTGLQRMLFLGADIPGYKAHVFSVTVEYHF